MKHTHTPGPWTVEIQFKTLTNVTTGEETRLPFFEVGSDLRRLADVNSGMNDEANAQLIASAPEMLAALEMLLNSMLSAQENQRLSVSELVKVRELILKARGES